MDLSNNMKIKHFIAMVKKYFSEQRIGYFWFMLTLTFALIIPFLMGMVISPQDMFIDLFTKFILDGDIALFSMVIIASLMIDNFMFEQDFAIFLNNGNELEHSELIKRFFVFIFPLLMVIFCLIAYVGCNMQEKQIYITAFIVAIELTTFFAIAAYAAYIKQLSWEKKISLRTKIK